MDAWASAVGAGAVTRRPGLRHRGHVGSGRAHHARARRRAGPRVAALGRDARARSAARRRPAPIARRGATRRFAFAARSRRRSSAPATTTPAHDRPLFLPYLAGERAPVWRADVRGAFEGLARGHDARRFPLGGAGRRGDGDARHSCARGRRIDGNECARFAWPAAARSRMPGARSRRMSCRCRWFARRSARPASSARPWPPRSASAGTRASQPRPTRMCPVERVFEPRAALAPALRGARRTLRPRAATRDRGGGRRDASVRMRAQARSKAGR